MVHRVRVIGVHVFQDIGLGLGDRGSCFCIRPDVGAFQPDRLGEAADVMGAFDSHPEKAEIAETGIKGGLGVQSQEAAVVAFVLGPLEESEHGDAGAGLWVLEPRCFLEQQRPAGVRIQIAGMVRQLRKQHQRAHIAIKRDRHQRPIGPTAPRFMGRRQHRRPGAADQGPGIGGMIGLGRGRRLDFTGCGFFGHG